jgi:hypothetical protein
LVSAHQQIQFIMQAKLDHLQRTALLSDMARVGTPTLHSAESVHRRTVLHSLVVAVARSTRVRAVRTVPAHGTGPDRLRVARPDSSLCGFFAGCQYFLTVPPHSMEYTDQGTTTLLGVLPRRAHGCARVERLGEAARSRRHRRRSGNSSSAQTTWRPHGCAL